MRGPSSPSSGRAGQCYKRSPLLSSPLLSYPLLCGVFLGWRADIFYIHMCIYIYLFIYFFSSAAGTPQNSFHSKGQRSPFCFQFFYVFWFIDWNPPRRKRMNEGPAEASGRAGARLFLINLCCRIKISTCPILALKIHLVVTTRCAWIKTKSIYTSG